MHDLKVEPNHLHEHFFVLFCWRLVRFVFVNEKETNKEERDTINNQPVSYCLKMVIFWKFKYTHIHLNPSFNSATGNEHAHTPWGSPIKSTLIC